MHRITCVAVLHLVWPTIFFLFGAETIGIAKPTQTGEMLPQNKVAAYTYEVGSWIWDKETLDFQTCRFWKSFEIPETAPVKRALLRMTADNGYQIFLDGREIGKAGERMAIIEYDLSEILDPGTHVMAVEAFNGDLDAGIIVDLRVELINGQIIKIGSDASWLVVPNHERNWTKKTRPHPGWEPAMKVFSSYGWKPWVIKGPVLHQITYNFWQTGWFQIFLLSTCGIVILFCLQLMGRLAVQKKSQELLQLERARLARDLHDDLGARITQIVLFGEVTQRELPADTTMRTKLDQLCDRSRDLAKAISEMVWVVNSQRDTVQDFATYVCKYTEAFLDTTSIRSRFDVSADLPEVAFDLPRRRNLFLAVKESLNNAVKHSGASELCLRIQCRESMIEVIVEDDGKGFDTKCPNPDRNGLTNMMQRMKELGGDCNFFSQPGKGCRVNFKMPFAQTRRHFKWFKWQFRRNPDTGRI